MPRRKTLLKTALSIGLLLIAGFVVACAVEGRDAAQLLMLAPALGVVAAQPGAGMRIQQLQDRLSEINEESESILARAEAEKRNTSPDEDSELDGLLEEFNTTQTTITRMQAVSDMGAQLRGSTGRKTTPDKPGRQPAPETDNDGDDNPRMSGHRPEPNIVVKTDHNRFGFRSFGEQAMAVRESSRDGGVFDNRLRMAQTTYANEGVGADGGFAVAPAFRAEIVEKITGEDSLLGRTDQLVSSSNLFTFPKDETTPWQSTGGVQAYWESEAGEMNKSKVALLQETVKLNKLTAFVNVTEETLNDAPALDAYLRRKAPQKMDFKISHAIVQGDGVGKPTGILNSPSLVTVADANGGYIEPLDIYNMWSRLYGPLQSNAVWLANQSVLPELLNMQSVVKNVAGTENVGGGPVFLPPGGLSGSPYATLMGRPIIFTQACKPLNTPGDLILVDMKQYLTILRTTGIRVDTSIHFAFDQDLMSYKFVFRVGGQPWWNTAADPSAGSATLSWAIVLDTRT